MGWSCRQCTKRNALHLLRCQSCLVELPPVSCVLLKAPISPALVHTGHTRTGASTENVLLTLNFPDNPDVLSVRNVTIASRRSRVQDVFVLPYPRWSKDNMPVVPFPAAVLRPESPTSPIAAVYRVDSVTVRVSLLFLDETDPYNGPALQTSVHVVRSDTDWETLFPTLKHLAGVPKSVAVLPQSSLMRLGLACQAKGVVELRQGARCAKVGVQSFTPPREPTPPVPAARGEE